MIDPTAAERQTATGDEVAVLAVAQEPDGGFVIKVEYGRYALTEDGDVCPDFGTGYVPTSTAHQAMGVIAEFALTMMTERDPKERDAILAAARDELTRRNGTDPVLSSILTAGGHRAVHERDERPPTEI